jgi:hypothetical protein
MHTIPATISLPRRIVLSFTLGFALFALTAIVSASPVFAATRYVNQDSSGAATNPTRPFDHPSYTANDSYKTFSAAYTAAAVGDTIELSGGPSGKLYTGHTSTLQKNNLVITGSSIAGHNGVVTFNNNPSNTDHTISINASGVTLQKVTLTKTGGTAGQFTLRIVGTNAAIKDVTVANTTGVGINVESAATGTTFTNFRVDTATIGGVNAMSASRGFTMTNSVFSGLKLTGIAGISFQTNSGTSTLNNVVFDQVASGAIKITSGTTVNMTNCAITAVGFNYGRSIIFASAGTLNTTNCFIQGPFRSPHSITDGAGTWNSTNDIINEYANYTNTPQNFGYLMLEIDDRHNLSHFKTIADYAKANYNMKLAVYVHDTENLTPTDKTSMQQLYLDGHEIALHGRHHTNMGVTGPWRVTYTGTSTNNVLVISSASTSLAVTGSADAKSPISLTAASTDTLAEVCALIESWANYNCVLTGDSTQPTKGQIPASVLKDASTSLPRNVATTILYDDNPGPTNRYLTEEVTRAIADLEAAMDENPLTADYVVETFGYPYSKRTDFTTTWMENNTDLTSVRSVATDSLQNKSWLGNIDLFAFHNSYNADEIYGSGYAALSTAAKQERIEVAARAMVTAASMGVATGFVGHNPSQDLSVQEWLWLIDEIAVYAPTANVKVTTEEAAVEEITTSGLWTDQGNGFWARTFTGAADLTPRSQSLMVNAGVAVAGRTTDIAGNALVGAPDIGAYEFGGTPTPPPAPVPVPPPSPTTPPTTTVSGIDGSWHNADVTATLTCTPAANSTCATTYYTTDGNTPTTASPTGTSVVFSADGVFTLKFFSVDNHGNAEAVQTSSIQVKIDKTAPTVPATPANSSPANDATPTWNWTASTDSGSGLGSPTYTVEWSQAADFSAGVNQATVNTNSFTHSTNLVDGTWYFRVKAVDAVANQTVYSANGSTVINTVVVSGAPTAPTYIDPVNGAINQKLTAALNWASSTDPEGNPITYDIYFGESPAALSLVVNKTGNFYNPTLQDTKTYYWQVVAKDNQGNSTPGAVSSFSTYQRIAVPDNLAKNKPIFSSNAIASGVASYVNDGMRFSNGARAFDTMEAVRTNTMSGQVSVDLGAVYTINSITFQVEDDDSYKVQTSANGTSWTTFGTTSPVLNTTVQTTYQTHTMTLNRTGVRYVRIVPVSGNYIFRMSEIEVYQ